MRNVVDTSGLENRILRKASLTGQRVNVVARDQMRLLQEELVKRSIPNVSKTRKQIDANINAAFRPSKRGRTAVPVERWWLVRNHRRSGRRMLVQAAVINSFRKLIYSRIGLLAKGWVGGGNPLGAKVAVIVQRQHVVGLFVIKEGATSIILTATNNATYATKVNGYVALVQSVVILREGKVHRQCESIVKSGWKK